jgi:hypothetical protein
MFGLGTAPNGRGTLIPSLRVLNTLLLLAVEGAAVLAVEAVEPEAI